MELYYYLCLWLVPIKVRYMIHSLELYFLLASQYKQDKFRRFLFEIYITDFSTVPLGQGWSSCVSVPWLHQSWWRLFFYNPYSRCVVDVASSRIKSRFKLPHPYCYPTGVVPGSSSKAISEANIGIVPVFYGLSVVDVVFLASSVSSYVLKSDAFAAVSSILSSMGVSCDIIATISQSIESLNTDIASST